MPNRVPLSALLTCCLLAGAHTSPAAVTATAVEAGGDVVFTASGSINLGGISVFDLGGFGNDLDPNEPRFVFGSFGGQSLVYNGILGPDSIGPSTALTFADTGTGDEFGIAEGNLVVFSSYSSNDPLSGSMTFTGTDFATLGLTEGIYVWTWGAGATADSLTLTIGNIPEPSTSATLLLALSTLLFGRRRRN